MNFKLRTLNLAALLPATLGLASLPATAATIRLSTTVSDTSPPTG